MSSQSISYVAADKTETNLINVINLRNSLDNVETYSSLWLSSLKEKLHLLYETSINWLESIEHKDKYLTLKTLVFTKSKEWIEIIKSHQINFKLISSINQFKSLFKEASRQAIIFGCGGLLTGALIGLCVGYNVRVQNQIKIKLSDNKNGLMRAVLLSNSNKGVDGLMLTVIKTPQVLSADEVLIQVRAVGIDMIDVEIANGYAHRLRQYLGLRKLPEPMVLGRECSGIVVDVGNQVESLEINDRVWAYLPIFASQDGFMSEYAVVSEKYVGLKPNNISFEGAATMPYAFITFRQKSQLNPQDVKNKRVLLHLGLSSKNDGVGLLATQLFKSWGGRVTICCVEPQPSSTQLTFLQALKTLGAESQLILPQDHSQISNLAQRLFDIVINTDHSSMSPILANFCKHPNDTVIETMNLQLNSKGLFQSMFNSFFLTSNKKIFQPKDEQKEEQPNYLLNECKKLVESRMIVPVVAKSFVPSQYDQAFRHVSKTSDSALAQATVGKCVLVFKSTF